jgi:L-asparagine oxygenase
MQRDLLSSIIDDNDDFGAHHFHLSPLLPRSAHVFTWTIPDSMRHSLEVELGDLRWTPKDSISATKAFIEDAKKVVHSHIFPENSFLQRVLVDLVSDTGLIDAVILYNVPMDPYIPATPTDGKATLDKPTNVAEAILMAIGELAGTYTIGYRSEKHYSNPWVHEGFPRQGEGVSALTAVDEVSLHQDMSYQTTIPDLLGLVCLRGGNDSQVQTNLVNSAAIADRLPDDVVKTLRGKRFRIAAPSEWVDTTEVELNDVRPVLEGKSLHLPVHWDNMIGVDDGADQALAMLKKVLLEVEPVGVHLEDGMMMLFNNQKVVHGRTPYTQLRFDGGDRVVYRSYFARHLSRFDLETRII